MKYICDDCQYARVRANGGDNESEFICCKKHTPVRFDMCNWYVSLNDNSETFQDLWIKENDNQHRIDIQSGSRTFSGSNS